MEPIRLDDVTALPTELAHRLLAVDDVFRAHKYIDSVAGNARVRPLVAELEDYLHRFPVRGYHCTREPVAGYFAREGLRLTNVEAHQNEFLRFFGDRFTTSELQEMAAAWQSYFVGISQIRNRNGRLWFCLTKATAGSDGTRVFFKHFGGEAIFMPLKRHRTIAEKLGSIGLPVIVEVRLPPGAPSKHLSLALPLLSAYHLTRYPDAQPWLAQTFVQQPVPARDVLSVTPV